MTTIQSLPKIISVISKTDHGPCDAGATAVCPHCGADGRYIYTFLCEDGTIRGAMAGCIQLFPRHPLAHKVQAVFDKAGEYAKKHWNLAQWDNEIIQATGLLESKEINTQEWENRVNRALYNRDAYLSRKYGRPMRRR